MFNNDPCDNISNKCSTNCNCNNNCDRLCQTAVHLVVPVFRGLPESKVNQDLPDLRANPGLPDLKVQLQPLSHSLTPIKTHQAFR